LKGGGDAGEWCFEEKERKELKTNLKRKFEQSTS